MPIDYKKYPSNWLTEIRPRILKRANYTCEFDGCNFKNKEIVWAVKQNGKTICWERDLEKAIDHPVSFDAKTITFEVKKIKVILTICSLLT